MYLFTVLAYAALEVVVTQGQGQDPAKGHAIESLERFSC